MTKERTDADASLVLLKNMLTPDARTLPLESAVSSTLLDIFNLRVPNGITVTALVPAKNGGGGDMRQLTALSEDVPGTTLKSVKVNVDGNYKNYPGLMAYLASLQQGPVAVTRLKVNENAFEASLRIYGSMEKK